VRIINIIKLKIKDALPNSVSISLWEKKKIKDAKKKLKKKNNFVKNE
jgi:hypothetical protein|tara:strand:- start:78 stop:218 length:141 start_codon:yes stop_codon:yes gene_type:complete